MDFLDRPNLENPHKTPTSQAKPGANPKEFKTDEALRDPRRQRPIYIAPSHKLSRAKATEYNLCTEGDELLKDIEEKFIPSLLSSHAPRPAVFG